ncbi:chemotaxis protein CheW [Methylopila sp. M107]|uniref:chemotaxis protein CheW n=1 Tax=Methylopila sp. M107 TaxID=1101190 RepID=UPI0003676CDC|nr:chemotaxis protein CheW [Methylopila sp. M107]
MSDRTDSRRGFVTVEIAGQLFGIAIERVREVFRPERITRVPLAGPEIAGVLNLRGRIVTAIDMRVRLDRPPAGPGAALMAIGVDRSQEDFALLVDRPGDVIEIEAAAIERTPMTLHPNWRALVEGVHRMEDKLMLILDVDRAIGADEIADAA